MNKVNIPQKNAKCVKTLNGFLVNFYGFCFYVTNTFQYQVWQKTIDEYKQSGKAYLPPTNEYGWLKNQQKCPEQRLTDTQQRMCKKIAETLKNNPLWMVKKGPEKRITFSTNSTKTTFGNLAVLQKIKEKMVS